MICSYWLQILLKDNSNFKASFEAIKIRHQHKMLQMRTPLLECYTCFKSCVLKILKLHTLKNLCTKYGAYLLAVVLKTLSQYPTCILYKPFANNNIDLNLICMKHKAEIFSTYNIR